MIHQMSRSGIHLSNVSSPGLSLTTDRGRRGLPLRKLLHASVSFARPSEDSIRTSSGDSLGTFLNLRRFDRFARAFFQLAFSFRFFFRVEGGMGCGQARYGHAIRRTAHVVQSNLITESDRLRVAAVFAADADLQIGFDVAATLGPDPHQLAAASGGEPLE